MDTLQPIRPVTPRHDISKMKSITEVKHNKSVVRYSPDEIRVGIQSRKKPKSAAARVMVGKNITKELRWQHGDRLEILFDETHMFLRRVQDGPYKFTNRPGSRGQSHHVGGMVTFSLYKDMPFAGCLESFTDTVEWCFESDGLLVEWPSRQKKANV